ncbi:hypothetical protein CRQ32_13410 [Salmonella enterica]|nr:hypothetical protein [Salmonella enterica]MIP14764.1 hypothetical protein [Salmonella enterica]MLA08959.1 hypothetical protein [Salmonella enterica subsp. enterica]
MECNALTFQLHQVKEFRICVISSVDAVMNMQMNVRFWTSELSLEKNRQLPASLTGLALNLFRKGCFY